MKLINNNNNNNNNNKTNLKITEQIMPHSQLIKRLLSPALWKRKKEKKR
jgi:hypothetical protein